MSAGWKIASWLACLAALAGCQPRDRAAARSGPGEALSAAADYARTHYPKGTFTPDGPFLSYSVEDHGDTWIVELQQQAQAGGGLHMLVRKRDMKVLSALRTQ